MQNFVTIGGVTMPQPHRGLTIDVATIVDSARNANGEVVGQKVGRDQQKLSNLEWVFLPAETWQSLLRVLDSSFFVSVTYPDMVQGGWTTRTMYPGDRHAEPMWLDENGVPSYYLNCKVNLIDAGQDGTSDD